MCMNSLATVRFIPHSLSRLIIQAFRSMSRRSTALYTLGSSLVPLTAHMSSELFVHMPRLVMLRARAGSLSIDA